MNKPEINVTPLIDVLLVLLIIFMVVTPLKPSSFDAKIPSEPKDDGVEPNILTLVVVYENDGKLRLNKERTETTVDEPAVLIGKIGEIFRLREENGERERTVFIKAPKALDYGSVAKIIDAVKAAGAEPVSLQIDALE